MRYPLGASLGAGGGLGIVGALLVEGSRKYNPKMIVCCFFPVVFSIHQLIEAINRRALERPGADDDLFLKFYPNVAFGYYWPIFSQLVAAVAKDRRDWRRV